MKRPILYWVILFILGALFYRILSIYIIGILGMIVVMFVLQVRRLERKWVLQSIGIIFFFLGVFCMYSWNRMYAICNMKNGTTVVFEGRVRKKEETTNTVSYIVKIDKMNGKALSTNIQIYLENHEPIILGTEIVGVGVVESFSTARNPGEYDELDYKRSSGILLKLEDVNITKEKIPKCAWRAFLDSVQDRLADVYSTIFEQKNASLALAMVLGDKKNLDEDIKALYQRNGIAHLIAISGLHIAMIGGLLYKLLRRTTGSYTFSACVGIVFLIAYGVMTGLSGATLRAIIMLVLSIGADVTGRKYDGLTAISVALLIMLMSNPYQITQVGFLLSFGAVMGIAVVQPIWKIWFPNLPRIFEGVFVSTSVQLMLTPILLYYFYELPMYSIFLNVLVVPLMNILLIMLIACGIIGLFSCQYAVIPAMLANGIFSFYEWLCNLSELLPGHTLCTGRPEAWWIILYYGVLGFVIWFSYQEKKRKAQRMLLSLMVLFVFFFVPKSLKVCIFDVGQGDGIYIRTSNRQHILVDGGSSTEKGLGQYTLKNGLKFYGCNKLDYVFVSHSDSDHYSGIKDLLELDLISIENFVLPAIDNPDESYHELEKLAVRKGCKLYYMKKGDYLKVDDVVFQCLNPIQQSYRDKNAGSIVLQMQYKSFDMLLTGDLNEEEEYKILPDINSGIEVLKVAHHGSATSTSKAFLQKVQPAIACVSVGMDNRYGHPSREVMERLQQFAGKIYLTKDSGAITIETDGIQYEISSFLE